LDEATAILRVVVRRALAGDDLSNIPLHFEAAVLDRYRSGGFSLIRTDTVGRIKKEGGWSLDVGIPPDDESLLHVFAADLLRLPGDEREHWAQFAVALPSSKMMLQMRLAPGSCFDDGEVRQW
jgi:hypothetical protein